MTTKVDRSVLVDVPVTTAYNQWTQFEEFPRFMDGVEQVRQLADDRLEWVAEIAGVRRQWIARILEQVPDQKVAWAAEQGATNAGAVTFSSEGGSTRVHLQLEFEPTGLLEGLADKLNLVERQAEADLERFKEFIEAQASASGAWRGAINEGSGAGTPTVADAAASRDDSGTVDDTGIGDVSQPDPPVGGGSGVADPGLVREPFNPLVDDLPGEDVDPHSPRRAL